MKLKKNYKIGIRMKFSLFVLVLGILIASFLSQMTYYVVRCQKVGKEDYSNKNFVAQIMYKTASFAISDNSSTYSDSLLKTLQSLSHSMFNTEMLIYGYEQDQDKVISALKSYLYDQIPDLCETYELKSLYMIYVNDLLEEVSEYPEYSDTDEAASSLPVPVYWCSALLDSDGNAQYDASLDEPLDASAFYGEEFAGLRDVIWKTKVATTSLDITTDESGEKTATVYVPVYDIENDDEILAVLGADLEMDTILRDIRNQVIPMTIVIIICVLLLMLLLILFINRIVLDPVRDLNAGVSGMLEGKWDATAKVHSNDELGEIAEIFNEMSSNIGSHIQNMEDLNDAYSRFIPEKMIQLQNADSIVNIHEGDFRTIPGMTIMSMQIDDIERRCSEMSPSELFSFLNRVSSMSIPVVTSTEEHEQGTIEKMENGGLEVFYEESTEQALIDALRICKEAVDGNSGNNLDLSFAITRGEVLLGVVGREERMEFVAFSEQKQLAEHLIEIADSYYANVLISEQAANNIPDFRNRYHARLLCYVDVENGTDENGKTITKKEAIYDVFDSDPEEQNQLKQYTADTFEKGVMEYAAGEYEKASRHFLEVLRINVNDRGARQYI